MTLHSTNGQEKLLWSRPLRVNIIPSIKMLICLELHIPCIHGHVQTMHDKMTQYNKNGVPPVGTLPR